MYCIAKIIIIIGVASGFPYSGTEEPNKPLKNSPRPKVCVLGVFKYFTHTDIVLMQYISNKHLYLDLCTDFFQV